MKQCDKFESFTIGFYPDETWLEQALEKKKKGEYPKILVVITSKDRDLTYKTVTNVDNLERFVCCTDVSNQ